MNKKLIFSIIVAILAILAVFAYVKFNKPEPVNPDNGNTPLVSNENEKYKGETILESDGWKKYTNPYWGIEFRFQDKEDKVEMVEDSSGITIRSRGIPPHGIYIYIYINDYNFLSAVFTEKDYKYENGQFLSFISLQEYIEKGRIWDYLSDSSGKLISMKEVKNENNVNFIETSVDYGSGIVKMHFIEYLKNGKNYIEISNAYYFELGRQLLSSFRFID
ncbi:MAG: hypothetical protein WC435_04080 [Candidatus Paceibacterota bacterium]